MLVSQGTAYRVVHNRDVVPHLALCCHGWFGKCKEGESSCPYQHSTEVGVFVCVCDCLVRVC